MAIDIKRNYISNISEDEREKKQKHQEELDRMMKEFLAKGGKVEKLAPGIAKGGVGTWDRGGKPRYTDAELKAQWKKEQENGSENTTDTGWDPRAEQ
jgi:hypothetical protein